MEVLLPTAKNLERACQSLASGLLVAFPTETVYGLGANAADVQALNRLYAAKGRPLSHPVIVHISGVDQLENWASSIPAAALALAERLWPGPLTLILPKAAHVSAQVTGGQDSVGLRVPSHPVALELLRAFGGGIAAPSANKFGRLSPTCAQFVAEDFDDDEIAIILDGGLCDVGIESTIVDFTSNRPRILRPGMVLKDQIEQIISGTLAGGAPPDGPKPGNVRAPGGLPSHYAPNTALALVESQSLNNTVAQLVSAGKRVCVLSFSKASDPRTVRWLEAPAQPQEYARRLYHNLRQLDRESSDLIIVEKTPDTPEWAGISDRLKRAAADAELSHLAPPNVVPPLLYE